jgi:hypothetical protein
MDLNYSSEELAFRDEVRAWLAKNLPRELKQKVENYEHLSKEDLLRWHRILADKGWVAPAWPKEWGGTGWNVVQRYIFEEELGYSGGPPLIPFGLTMCAAVLLQFGTDAQKKKYLPRIYRGEDFWCQGYSEPGSGSDLASLKTKAVRQGRSLRRSTGQKIWTTLAHYADWIFCLVRTDSGEKRQDGISFLLIDMKTPGITIRPLILMDGAHEVNEVFFDDVKVPVENRVHDEGKGWTVAKYLLGYERMNTGPHRRLEARAREGQGIFQGRCRSAVPRSTLPPGSRADGARDHQPALPRSHAPHRPAAGRRRVDAEDQGHRDPAGPDRARVRRDGSDGERRILGRAAQALSLDAQDRRSTPARTRIQRNIISKMTLSKGCL